MHIYSTVFVYLSLFIHLPIKGYFGCFHVFAITNKATIHIHIHVQIFIWMLSFKHIWVNITEYSCWII